MTQAELRAQVRELIGSDTYDRSFKDEWTNDALNWACEQTACMLGLTRNIDRYDIVNRNRVFLPTSLVKIISVRIVRSVATPPPPIWS